MGIRYVVLGLLTQKSMTGYTIKTMFDGLAWLVDSPSYGSLYPILHTLLEMEWVTVEIMPNAGKPPRKIYSIAEKGRGALREWLDGPAPSKLSTKSFITWLMIVNNFSPDRTRDYLALRKNQIMVYLSRCKRTSSVDDATQNLGQGLVADYAQTLARAELDWLERKLIQLDQYATSFGGTELTNTAA